MTDLGLAATCVSDGETLDASDPAYLALPDLGPGTMVGRYVLTAKLGAGGMGVVHAAYDPQLDRRLAVKLVRGERAPDEDARHERLLREARAMARLDHPNVIRVFDAGTTEVRDRERVFVAMEYVDGAPLGTWARDKPWRRVVETCLAAGHGLAAAHAAGFVHRDFKPDNVLVDKSGRARVGDFGLVGAAGEVSRDNALTQEGAVMGTPGFMAPEQKRGEAVDARADQFSFCRTIDALVPRKPRWLAAIVARGLAEDPAARYPALDDVLGAIERKLRRRRRLVVGGGIAALAAIAVVVARPAPHENACSTLAGVWDATTRGGLPPVLNTALDRYAHDWTTVEDARCRANDRGAAADRMQACVELRRAQLDAVARQLRRVPAADQPGALAAVEALPSPHDCEDPTKLALEDPTPAAPQLRAAVAVSRAQLTAVRSLVNIGRFADAERLLDSTQIPPFPPLAAELAQARANLLSERDEDSAAAIGAYGSAIRLAAATGYEHLMLTAMLDRAFDLPDHVEALRWFDLAEGWIARLGNPPELVAHLHGNRSQARLGAGDLAGAVEDARTCFEIRRDHEGPAAIGALNAAVNLVGALARADNDVEARRVAETTLADTEGLVGPDHTVVRKMLSNLVAVDLHLHDWAAARVALDRLMASTVRVFGPNHPRVRGVQLEMATLLSENGHPTEAIALFEAARPDVTGELAVRLHHDLAIAYSIANRHAEAMTEIAAAVASLTELVGPDHPALVGTRTQAGFIAYRAGDLVRAETSLRETLALAAKVLPPDSPGAANAHSTLALVLLARHQAPAAEVEATRAIQLTHGQKPVVEAEAQFALAQALAAQGKAGRSAAERALALYDQIKETGPDRAAVVAWLQR